MFSGIFAKISAALGVALAIAFGLLKLQSARVSKLKHEKKIVEKKAKIATEQIKAKMELIKTEPEKVDEILEKNAAEPDRLKRWNSL